MEQIFQTLVLSNLKSVIGTHMCVFNNTCYVCQLKFMPREKSVLFADFNLQFFCVNPYLGKFVFVKNLPDDNIGLPDL